MIYLDEAAGRWYVDGILQAAASRHFYTFNLLRKETWEPVVRAWETEMHAELWSRYQLDNFGALLVAAFRYAPDALPESSASRAERGLPALPAVSETDSRACSIGRFARANWYHEVLARLSDCARLVTEEAKSQGKALFSPRQWHRFVNSKFPEKALAIAAGLGTIGRNGLVIARRTDLTGFFDNADRGATAGEAGWSSAVVLGLMFLPFDFSPETSLPPRNILQPLALCGSCTSCIRACPSRALEFSEVPAYHRESCIQNYTSLAGLMPESVQKAWGRQLYGCDICLEACPWFKPDSAARSALGCIGGFFDAAAISEMSDDQLKLMLKGSALDQKWIEPEALRRNARLVLQQRGSAET